MLMRAFQRDRLIQGVPKEAELINRRGVWFFQLVLELPDILPLRLLHTVDVYDKVLGIDLGENVIAALSSGKLFRGGQLCHERDRFLAMRSRIQSNGSESSKQLLRKVSGREKRYVKYTNHLISKAIIQEAIKLGYTVIALEKLTNIRKRIKAGKRVRSRLHRWAWDQLQNFIEYKAKAAGLKVIYGNPAYTSKMCADCGALGIRRKDRFECTSCGILRHSDLNASLNSSKIALSTGSATVPVNAPNVATAQRR
jgi:putative transposase